MKKEQRTPIGYCTACQGYIYSGDLHNAHDKYMLDEKPKIMKHISQSNQQIKEIKWYHWFFFWLLPTHRSYDFGSTRDFIHYFKIWKGNKYIFDTEIK